ncbi:OmpA-OmpF porin, OOP family [Colwellia chukchiensis]|uniref:OmpA-OmpF porin, OOP family n=1 Tax=Colwellia chukchiensis TaxID=641665 RepID=A0A1H7R588_9GAMM|nr:OmpA family protein [Colwellia chukchiensis]SEL55401.1 OmpA-OmpF porin, OOP family [Colwellia chukchiensis]
MRQQQKLGLLISGLICAFNVNAQEQPKAADLVGKNYLGIHGMRMNTDDDRLAPNNVDYIRHANGIGLEFGHRLSEYSELRLSYTRLNLTRTGWAPSTPSGKNIAANYLYFPNKQNFYVMAGASAIDVVDSDLSANIGAGYRHYLSERSAVYFEGNGHYQFDNKYTDLSAQIGLVYFFGDTAKKIVRSAPAPTQIKPAAPAPVAKAELDSDNDGVIDRKDQCPNTPAANKVDSDGCTIFTEANDEMRLLVNFDNAKAIVKPEYLDNIKVAADFLKQYPHTDLTISGHTSSQGAAAYNKKLSQQRAEAIVDVLVQEFGIAPSRLTAEGKGEEELLNPANTATAHAENRRIEAKVSVKRKIAVKR